MTTIDTILLISLILGGVAIIAYLVITKQWTQIRQLAYQLMLRAEKVFTGINGQEKFAVVLTELYDRIPPWLKLFVTRRDLEVMMQRWYDAAKDWLDDGQINGSTPASTPRR